jgi:hypothetical protein
MDTKRKEKVFKGENESIENKLTRIVKIQDQFGSSQLLLFSKRFLSNIN